MSLYIFIIILSFNIDQFLKEWIFLKIDMLNDEYSECSLLKSSFLKKIVVLNRRFNVCKNVLYEYV